MMDPLVLEEAAAQGALFFRAIVSLDRAGLAMRIWPSGFGGRDDRLLFVPPGCTAIVPMSVATSDCVRFSPSGQRRLEMYFRLSCKDGALFGDFQEGSFAYASPLVADGDARSVSIKDIQTDHGLDRFIKLFEF